MILPSPPTITFSFERERDKEGFKKENFAWNGMFSKLDVWTWFGDAFFMRFLLENANVEIGPFSLEILKMFVCRFGEFYLIVF